MGHANARVNKLRGIGRCFFFSSFPLIPSFFWEVEKFLSLQTE